MNILITGIHGFVGNNLVVALRQKHTIYGMDIVSHTKEGIVKTFSWNELDIIPPVEVIIHLAGKAHDTKNTTAAQDYFDINVGLTKQIFDYFLQSNATKFIFFSSVKAVADSVQCEYLTEEMLPNPLTAYGKSKLEAERFLRKRLNDYTREREDERARKGEVVKGREAEGEKRVYILRPCMIHGPGNKGNLNLLYKIVSKGIPWPLGAFDNNRSFCSIDNLSFVIQNLIESDIETGIYQVSDDESLSTNALITLIAESLHSKPSILKLNKSFISAIAKTGNVFHLPLNSERLRKLTKSYVVSNNKLKAALDIDKIPVSAKDGMRRTLDSFK